MINIQHPVNDFSSFHKYAQEYFLTERIAIPSSFRLKVQSMVIKKLGFQNINQVRDKYEGQAYLDKIMLTMTSKYILKKYFANEMLIDFDTISSPEKQNIITIEETIYQLVPFYFGSLPNMTAQSNLPLIFCCIRPDFCNGSVYGYLNRYSMNNEDLFLIKSIGITINYEFIGFKNLEKLPIIK